MIINKKLNNIFSLYIYTPCYWYRDACTVCLCVVCMYVRVCVCACVCVCWYSKHIHRIFPECLHRNFHLLSIVALASIDALPKLPSTILHLNGTAPYPHYTSVVSPFNHCGSFFALQSQHAFVNDAYCTYHNRGWRSAYYTTLPVVRISVSRGPAGDSYKVLDANGWRLLVLYSKSMVLMIVRH